MTETCAPLDTGFQTVGALVEYAGEAERESRFLYYLVRVARTGVEILAGVPSIIFGLFGFVLFVVTLEFGFSLLSAGLSGACLVLPVIIRTTEEALRAVPRSYREASLGLGATKWQTTVNVVLPTALPGSAGGRNSSSASWPAPVSAPTRKAVPYSPPAPGCAPRSSPGTKRGACGLKWA